METYDAVGRLSSVKRIGSVDQVTLHYGTQGYLESVVDQSGALLQFSYNAMGDVSQVTTSGGETILYEYTPALQLERVRFSATESIQYHYENSFFPQR